MKTLYRNVTFSRDAIDVEKRTVSLAFSSEEPVDRGVFGIEVLDHNPESVRLGRLKDGGPVLVDHNTTDIVGVVESVDINSTDRKGRAVVRFGKSDRASEVFTDVADGIRKSVSVGYAIHKTRDEENRVVRAIDWEPLEISIVAVPADAGVGIGRNKEVVDMKTEDKAAPAPKAVEKAPVIDVNAEREAVREREMQRITSIRQVADKFDRKELAEKYIASGESFDAFREAMFATLENVSVAADPTIGMDEKEQRSYSFVRVLNAMANPTDRRAQEAAAFEFECSAAASEKLKRESQGAMVPMDVLGYGRRDLNVGTATAGGNTVATELLAGSFIDSLENAMVISSMGAISLTGLNGNIAIPRQTGGATAFWVAESGSPTESQQAFDQVAMSPNTVGAFTDMSRKLLLQSSIDVESFVRNDLALRIALELDRVAINGSGTAPEPTGIINTTGIGSVAGGTNGAAPTWANIVGLESAVANVNAAIGALWYLTNTKARGKLKLTEKFSGTNGNPIFADGNTPLNGYATAISNAVPSNLSKGTGSNLSAIVFGNFADLVIGMWGGLDLTVDPFTGSTSGTVRVVALQDVDIAVRHAESFAAMLDAITV